MAQYTDLRPDNLLGDEINAELDTYLDTGEYDLIGNYSTEGPVLKNDTWQAIGRGILNYIGTSSAYAVIAHEWDGTSLRIRNWDDALSQPGAWGPYVNLKGDTGAQGIQGEVGPIGPIGPVGPQGETGPTAAYEWLGTAIRFMNPNGSWGPYVDLEGPVGDSIFVWRFQRSYNTNSIVNFNGVLYRCIQNHSGGKYPNSNPNYWIVYSTERSFSYYLNANTTLRIERFDKTVLKACKWLLMVESDVVDSVKELTLLNKDGTDLLYTLVNVLGDRANIFITPIIDNDDIVLEVENQESYGITIRARRFEITA